MEKLRNKRKEGMMKEDENEKEKEEEEEELMRMKEYMIWRNRERSWTKRED